MDMMGHFSGATAVDAPVKEAVAEKQYVFSRASLGVREARPPKKRSQIVGGHSQRRAERAQALAQLGELSSARQALEGSCVASGNLATLRSLTNPSRPWDPLPDSVVEHRATSTFALDAERFLSNLRCSKKGAAGGRSGMTCEHIRPLLERPSDSELLCNLAQELTEASTPASVLDMLRRGRRTIAQQLAPAVEEATAPFQYALTTRSGCESHMPSKL